VAQLDHVHFHMTPTRMLLWEVPDTKRRAAAAGEEIKVSELLQSHLW